MHIVQHAIGYNCIIYKIYCILTVRLAFSFSVQNAFAPILHWRHSAVLPEFPNQMARICKTHIVGYFLDRHTTVRDQIFDPFHSGSVYILPKSLVKMRPKITPDIPRNASKATRISTVRAYECSSECIGACAFRAQCRSSDKYRRRTRYCGTGRGR